MEAIPTADFVDVSTQTEPAIVLPVPETNIDKQILLEDKMLSKKAYLKKVKKLLFDKPFIEQSMKNDNSITDSVRSQSLSVADQSIGTCVLPYAVNTQLQDLQSLPSEASNQMQKLAITASEASVKSDDEDDMLKHDSDSDSEM